MPEAIEYVKTKEYIAKARAYAASNRNISKDRELIRKEIKLKKEQGCDRLKTYKEYKNIYSLGGFNKVWYSK